MAHQLRVEGDKVIELDVQGKTLATKDYSHVHAGYLATLHNPRVSVEAKQAAEQVLHELEQAHGDPPTHVDYHNRGGTHERAHVETHEEQVHRQRQIAAYKGILHKKDVSDEAKQRARAKLTDFGVNLELVEQEGESDRKGKIQ